MSHTVTDPSRGQRLRSFDPLSTDAVDEALAEAAAAQRRWRDVSLAERAAGLSRIAEALRDGRDTFATLMADEMGKPLAAGRSEIDKCAWVCEHYADHGPRYLAPTLIESGATKSYVAPRPLGVVLAVMPWNFPFWQVFRFLAPALVAGNGALLKHASNVPGCALAIESLVRSSGAAGRLSESLFRTLIVDESEVGRLLAQPAVAAATLTGSTAAGRAVAAEAGRHLKKVVLELGGSDPYLVLEDADLDLAADKCVTSRLINAGQSCIAAKRFLVVAAVHDAFVERVAARLKEAVVGDPRDADTTVGPLARADLRETLHRQVTESRDAGAEVALGGELPRGPGFFYPPTLLTGVKPGMPAFDEETFGPVAAVVRVADEAEGIALANRSSYGLGAAVFTADPERGRRIAEEELEAGCCFVNDFVRSDPRLPFGGIKQSGYGRELSRLGILEFCNQKTVYIA